jgi:hypothetical protein
MDNKRKIRGQFSVKFSENKNCESFAAASCTDVISPNNPLENS